MEDHIMSVTNEIVECACDVAKTAAESADTTHEVVVLSLGHIAEKAIDFVLDHLF